MEDEHDQIYIEDELNRPAKANLLKLIIIRLPSIILADFILVNSDIIFNEINLILQFANMNIMTYLFIQLLSRMVLITMIAFCFFLLTVRLGTVFNLYKLLVLVSLPFIFTTWMKFIRENSNHKTV